MRSGWDRGACRCSRLGLHHRQYLLRHSRRCHLTGGHEVGQDLRSLHVADHVVLQDLSQWPWMQCGDHLNADHIPGSIQVYVGVVASLPRAGNLRVSQRYVESTDVQVVLKSHGPSLAYSHNADDGLAVSCQHDFQYALARRISKHDLIAVVTCLRFADLAPEGRLDVRFCDFALNHPPPGMVAVLHWLPP